MSDRTTVAFVCVQNAGRSQMAAAFARRETAERELDSEVVRAMRAVDVDVGERTPREVTVGELRDSDYVVTMGCSAEDVCPAGWAGENRDWGLEDPDGKPPETVAEIRDEIESRVGTAASGDIGDYQ
jgi:arsenate reductase